ncbi:MAG: sigma-70 family RNA polymerase sigma factor [Bacteroidota bacterium]
MRLPQSLSGKRNRAQRQSWRREADGPAKAHAWAETLNDAELLQWIQADYETAFEVLFDRYHDSLRAFAASIAGEYHADEVVQEVFLDVWRRRHALKAKASLRAYLFQATRSRSLNAKRGRTRWARRFMGLDAAHNAIAPQATSSGDELAQAIAQAVACLPERQQTAFRLRREHDLSYAEIAVAMEVKPKTVENHLRRAAQAVRDAIPAELLRP